jgi:hypothetical protein
MFKRTPQQHPEPLGDRIEKFRAGIDAYIETRMKEMKQECPGVPETVLRRLVENRAPGCLCLQAIELERS